MLTWRGHLLSCGCMEFSARLLQYWPHVAAALTLLIALTASGHAILHKRDSRAAVLWVGVIWMVPILGAGLYLLLGVNRVRRKAAYLRGTVVRPQISAGSPELNTDLISRHPQIAHLQQLAEAVGRVVARPLLDGNQVEPLVNGDAAYPAMLAAIQAATRTVSLSTYIFDHDHSGQLFVDALRDAVKRGVQVRVLIDAAGSHYSVPSI